MRRRFTLNDFEHSLKEHADEFKMIPSKRVWHGIYNDIHPGRRWPSVAVALLFMFTLVVVGHLNTRNGIHAVTRYPGNLASKTVKSANVNKVAVIPLNQISKATSGKISPSGKRIDAKGETYTTLTNVNASHKPQQALPSGDVVTEMDFTDGRAKGSNVSLQKKTEVISIGAHTNNNLTRTRINTSLVQNSDGLDLANNEAKIQFASIQPVTNENLNLLYESAVKLSISRPADLSLSKTAKSLRHKKVNPNESWTYFAEPVISSVIFKGKSIIASPSVSAISPVGLNMRQNNMLRSSAFGLQAGIQFNYRILKKLKFISGFDLSYSGYRITSNEVHPTFATLTLRNKSTNADYSKNYVTHYGNGIGEAIITLRNYSWQVSLPVGLEYQIAGNNKIQFNTLANFEPSLILKSNSFLLSTEGANYVNDPSLLRKWNASSNVGAFVSFSAGKLKWQVGPNIRYQWFSTYKPDYTIKEHLIDYGIRIAITK